MHGLYNTTMRQSSTTTVPFPRKAISPDKCWKMLALAQTRTHVLSLQDTMQLGTETLRVETSRSEEDSGGWGFIKRSAGSVGGRRDYYGRGRTRALCRCLCGAVATTAQERNKSPPTLIDCVVSVVSARQRRLKLKSGGPVVMTRLLKFYEWMKIYIIMVHVKTSAQNLACWHRQIHTVHTSWPLTS